MALEKTTRVDLIEVTDIGCVQVRTRTSILDDGKVVSTNFHRHVIYPGDDFSRENARVQAICAVVHTPEIVANFNIARAA